MTPRQPTPGVPHFRVMTYNVHRERSGDAPTVAAVGDVDADIACLQEVTAAWEQSLRARYAQKYPYMLFHPKENAGGVAMLSRYPLEDHGIMPFHGDWHPGWLVEVDTPGGHIQVLNVHLRSLFNGDRDWVSNYLSTSNDHLLELDSFMSKRATSLPTVVVGDFNESPDGDAVHTLEADGFRNALPLFHPGQYTWQGASVAKALEMTIDHVLFDRSFEPLNARVYRWGNSDHLPVVADLEMRWPSGQ
jgi:endonuclease/exonuclease/phosphatase family metal-dependent hydrolase